MVVLDTRYYVQSNIRDKPIIKCYDDSMAEKNFKDIERGGRVGDPAAGDLYRAAQKVADRLECLGLSPRIEVKQRRKRLLTVSLRKYEDYGWLTVYVDANGNITPVTEAVRGKALEQKIEWVLSPEFDELVRSLPKANYVRVNGVNA